jgi:polyisoprenoid-binding protein YceI
MKSSLTFILLLVGMFTLAFKYKNIEYAVDKNQSKLTWIGRKVTGEHTGNIQLSEGKLITDGKVFKAGSFRIDMASLTNTDVNDEESRQKLLGHLKSDDFFATHKHAHATFVTTRVTPLGNEKYQVKGNLTIKGITKPISFPASVKVAGNEASAQAKIVVDRTKYDIKYGSGSFFDNLGDKAIDNEFELNVNLVAKTSQVTTE